MGVGCSRQQRIENNNESSIHVDACPRLAEHCDEFQIVAAACGVKGCPPGGLVSIEAAGVCPAAAEQKGTDLVGPPDRQCQRSLAFVGLVLSGLVGVRTGLYIGPKRTKDGINEKSREGGGKGIRKKRK